eukprot:3355777-Pleurochrysis_carterae.AAC.1
MIHVACRNSALRRQDVAVFDQRRVVRVVRTARRRCRRAMPAGKVERSPRRELGWSRNRL